MNFCFLDYSWSVNKCKRSLNICFITAFIFHITLFIKARKNLISILINFKDPLSLRIFLKIKYKGELRICIIINYFHLRVNSIFKLVKLNHKHAIIGKEDRKSTTCDKIHTTCFWRSFIQCCSITAKYLCKCYHFTLQVWIYLLSENFWVPLSKFNYKDKGLNKKSYYAIKNDFTIRV